jgi:hypothetical protein
MSMVSLDYGSVPEEILKQVQTLKFESVVAQVARTISATHLPTATHQKVPHTTGSKFQELELKFYQQFPFCPPPHFFDLTY